VKIQLLQLLLLLLLLVLLLLVVVKRMIRDIFASALFEPGRGRGTRNWLAVLLNIPENRILEHGRKKGYQQYGFFWEGWARKPALCRTPTAASSNAQIFRQAPPLPVLPNCSGPLGIPESY
jgi:hypothetical protein